MSELEKHRKEASILNEAFLVFKNKSFWEDLEKNKNNEHEVFNNWVSIIPSTKENERSNDLKTGLESLFQASLKSLLEVQDKPMIEARQWFETLVHNGASLDLTNVFGESLVEEACKKNAFEVGQMLTDIGFESIGEKNIKSIFESSLSMFFYMQRNDCEKLASKSNLKWINENKKILFNNQNVDKQMEEIWFSISMDVNNNGILDGLSRCGTREKIESRIKLCRLILEQNKNSAIPLLFWNSLCGLSWENEPLLSHNPTDKDVVRKNKMTQCISKLYETIKKYKFSKEADDFSVRMNLLEDLEKCMEEGRNHLGKSTTMTDLKSKMTLFSLYGLQRLSVDAHSLTMEQKQELSKKSLNIIAEKTQLEFEDTHTPAPELIASTYSYLRDPLQRQFLGPKDFFVPLKASPYMVCLEYMDGFPEDEKNKKIVEYLSQYPFPQKEVWLNYLNGPYTNYLNNAWKNALFLKEIKPPKSNLEVIGPEKKATFRF